MFDWDPIQSIIDNAAIRDHNEKVSAGHVLRYWAEMNAVEKQFPYKPDEPMVDVMAAKLEVHEKYWMPSDDNYWKPCSHGNQEQYAVADIESIDVLTDFRISFIVRIKIRSDSKRFGKKDILYLLQTEDGSEEGPVRIVNEFH
ncbi:MAG: hypothetical protein KDA65_08770 [Planctomycetaceae bacterium]|nr:hypothetical protein [Planctomycetaceae bacterium]